MSSSLRTPSGNTPAGLSRWSSRRKRCSISSAPPPAPDRRARCRRTPCGRATRSPGHQEIVVGAEGVEDLRDLERPADPRRVICRGSRPVMSRPSKRMRPAVGFRYPVTRLMNVVLPAPLPPMSPTTVSFAMLTLRSAAAVTARRSSSDVPSRGWCSSGGSPAPAKTDQSPSGRRGSRPAWPSRPRSCQVLGARS